MEDPGAASGATYPGENGTLSSKGTHLDRAS